MKLFLISALTALAMTVLPMALPVAAEEAEATEVSIKDAFEDVMEGAK